MVNTLQNNKQVKVLLLESELVVVSNETVFCTLCISGDAGKVNNHLK